MSASTVETEGVNITDDVVSKAPKKSNFNIANYRHPTTGEPCSRQRRYQILNNIAGKCKFHSGRDVVPGHLECQECLLKRNPTMKPYRNLAVIFNRTDWSLSDKQIAKMEKIEVRSVRRARSAIHPPGGGVVKLPEVIVRFHRVLDPSDPLPEVKSAARTLFTMAIADGTLKAQPCWCGDPHGEGHHEDYSKPLDVIWLCRKHHLELHAIKTRELLRLARIKSNETKESFAIASTSCAMIA